MSYVTVLKGVPDFNKCVISFWFMVAKQSIDKVSSEYVEDPGDAFIPFNGILPLVIMGKEGEGMSPLDMHAEQIVSKIHDLTEVIWVQHGSGEMTFFDNPNCFLHLGMTATGTYWASEKSRRPFGQEIGYGANTSWSQGGKGKPKNPTFIGLSCRDGEASLVVNFETAQKAAATSSATGYTLDQPELKIGEYWGVQNEDGNPSLNGSCYRSGTITVTSCFYGFLQPGDVSDGTTDVCAPPGIFQEAKWSEKEYPYNPAGTGTISFGGPGVTPDEWHHVLISLDLTDISVTNETVNSFAKLYVALDDADRKTNNTPSLISDDHGVIPGDASPRPNFSYSLSGAKIPSGGVELGVPGIAKYVGKIRDAYMAELLIFTGVTIDTSVEANRRLFITKPDKNGAKRPTNTTPLTIPMRKYAVGDPVKWEPGADWPAFAPGLLDPSGIPTVIKLNGKATIADVDFTKCQFNWQMGRNLGTSKSKVVRTGPVRAEYPDPKLTG